LLEQQLGQIDGSSRKTLGVKLGRAAAAVILQSRRDDGWQVQGTYEFVIAPGAYQTTPPWQGFVLHPGLAHAKPFLLASASQLRPVPPPSLAGRSSAWAFEEVKQLGDANSSARTEDQTQAAVWWMEFSEGLVNRLARRLVIEKQLGLWSTARLFALMNAALVDTYVAVWDAKYEFNHWRPYTAVHEAATDGNDGTRADRNWNSLRPAPPFPEYVSAHAAGCACTFTILARTFAMTEPLTMDSLTAPAGMPVRSFKTLRVAAQECADSRVWLGFHFRYSTEAGAALGRRSARYALTNYLRPRRQ
ncbi:MAG TPA: vanadium-dependent haloperoxidase, partial [Povalibacter sp.]